jgi:hypothetical protein
VIASHGEAVCHRNSGRPSSWKDTLLCPGPPADGSLRHHSRRASMRGRAMDVLAQVPAECRKSWNGRRSASPARARRR